MIKENLIKVQNNINEACKRSGRDAGEVQLIAVSKTKPLEMLKEAYEAGIRDFGENRVQELLEKESQLPDDIRWHMIGHLQTNKVKVLIDKAYLIHGVDSLHLAEEISKQAVKKNITVNILVEINIGNEASKFGTTATDALNMVVEIMKLPNICVKGLMTVAPFTDVPENNRGYFKAMKKLLIDINGYLSDNKTCFKENTENLSVLSMGMTGDYVVAIEEGSTFVRVGTGIFGERDYTI